MGTAIGFLGDDAEARGVELGPLGDVTFSPATFRSSTGNEQ